MKPKAEHCRIGGNRIFCMHCKAEIVISTPIDVRLLVAILKEFTKFHERCPILQPLPPPEDRSVFDRSEGFFRPDTDVIEKINKKAPIPSPPPPPKDRRITEGGYVKPPKCL